MPVYGGRRCGTHGLGFRRNEGVGASWSLGNLHVALAHVGRWFGRMGGTVPTSLAFDKTLVQISAPKALKLTPGSSPGNLIESLVEPCFGMLL